MNVEYLTLQESKRERVEIQNLANFVGDIYAISKKAFVSIDYASEGKAVPTFQSGLVAEMTTALSRRGHDTFASI